MVNGCKQLKALSILPLFYFIFANKSQQHKKGLYEYLIEIIGYF